MLRIAWRTVRISSRTSTPIIAITSSQSHQGVASFHVSPADHLPVVCSGGGWQVYSSCLRPPKNTPSIGLLTHLPRPRWRSLTPSASATCYSAVTGLCHGKINAGGKSARKSPHAQTHARRNILGLGPIEPLRTDRRITEVMVNGWRAAG